MPNSDSLATSIFIYFLTVFLRLLLKMTHIYYLHLRMKQPAHLDKEHVTARQQK